jgi:hypothetical protein
MTNSYSIYNSHSIDLPDLNPVILKPKSFISLFTINGFHHNAVNPNNFKSFDPDDVANALLRVSPLDLGGSSAASTDEE